MTRICCCKDCPFKKEPQPIENFYSNRSRKDGLANICKICAKNAGKKSNKKHRTKVLEKKKQYRETHRKDIALKKQIWDIENTEHRRQYREENRPKIVQQNHLYYTENKENILEKNRIYTNKKRKTDVNFNLQLILRRRLWSAIKGNFKGGSAVRDLGCSINDLRLRFISIFVFVPEANEMMTWENHGRLWHIDHIIPLSAFDLTDPEQVKKACHYTNLRPLWKVQNMRDRDRGMSRNRKKK